MHKPLRAMSVQERREWAESTHADLTSFCAYVQQHLDRRGNNQRRGRG